MSRPASRGFFERLSSSLAVVLIIPVAACVAVSVGREQGPGPDRPVNVDDAQSPPDSSTTFADAGAGDAPTVPTFAGSPLCNASESTGCYPDWDTTKQIAPVCGYSDASTTPVACRVSVHAAMGAPVSSCDTQPAGTGTDGDACQKSTDCALGFECVGATAGQCRHYCCMADSCLKRPTDSFCDIQSVAAVASTKVPVCMPVSPCALLVDNQCPSDQTCAVVRVDGTTSCVSIGSAQAGDACDKEHCGAGLTCLGNVGSRVCAKLCHTDTPTDCASGLKCTTSVPQFQDPRIGVCK